MMQHHGPESYDVAVSKAAAHFKTKLEEQIHSSVERVTRVVEQIQNDVPTDAIVAGRTLQFEATTANGVVVYQPAIETPLTLHEHALRQVAARTNIRNMGTVVSELRAKGNWGAQLIARMMQEVYSHLNGD